MSAELSGEAEKLYSYLTKGGIHLGKRPRYTEEEIAFIEDNYKELSVKELADRLGRTEKGVRGKMNSLGIDLQELGRQHVYKNYVWSAEEVGIIKKYSDTLSDKEIYDKFLNYMPTDNWVYKKRRELGLKGVMPYRHGVPYLNGNGYYSHYVGGETVWLHRQVAEEKEGRKLTDKEKVHHINGLKTDNTPENLYVCSDRSHHAIVHNQLEEAAFELVREGIIIFDHSSGTYFVDKSRGQSEPKADSKILVRGNA